MSRILSVAVVCALVTSARLLHGAEEPQQIDPQADKVLRAAGAYLQQLQSFRCDATATLKVSLGDMTNEMTSEYSIALRRPNQVAILLKKGELGASIVSDGKQAYHYIPAMKKHTVADAPQGPEQLFAGESAMLFTQGGMMFIPALLAADPAKTWLEGVTGGQHLGEETIDGAKCHHLRFFQPQMDWDVWIESGDRPLLRKIVPDMSKTLAQAAPLQAFGNVKMETSLVLRDWQPNAAIAADVFRFQPPPDSKQVQSFLEGLIPSGQPELHALVGKPAPDFEAKLLDGGTLKLSDLKEKVVILDFWATWCGPCVAALPILTQVAKDYEKQGIAFFAVNVGEEQDVIREFLKEKQLEMKVALDPDSKVSELFGVQGIPQTVLVGKDGKVQVVHVGFSPDLKDRLSKELDSLVKGEDLAGKTLREKEEAERTAAAEMEGASQSWSLPGRWTAVAAEADVAVAATGGGAGVQVDAQGNKQRELKIESQTGVLRVANLLPDGPRELLSYSPWGQSVEAYSLTGEHLWSYGGGQGIDDVWAFDL
ncbi:MAG: DUF2092 domain-containing protein, partial [Planctomycetes bacterium]|nr:DUF2092 domain-containing protein [Planctomycetota bacterium]